MSGCILCELSSLYLCCSAAMILLNKVCEFYAIKEACEMFIFYNIVFMTIVCRSWIIGLTKVGLDLFVWSILGSNI